MIIIRDVARTYGVVRLVRRCRGLLGGILAVVTALTGMLCVITLAFIIVAGGSAGASETEDASIPSELVRGWLLLLAIFLTGWVAGTQLRRQRRSMVLWLRRFGYGDATRVVTSALGHIGRSWRVVTLDDRATEPVGVAGALRWGDAVITVLSRVVKFVARWAVRIAGPTRVIAIIGIVAAVAWTLQDGGLEALGPLMDELASPTPPLSATASVVLLCAAVLVLQLVVLIAYLVVMLIAMPLIGVSTLVDGIRSGVRSAERDKLRTIDTVGGARTAVGQVQLASQQPLAARLTVLDVDSSVWRETVVAFARACSAVVIDISKPSTHVAWEVEQVQAGQVRQVFVGQLDLVTALSEGGEVPTEADDVASVDELRRLLEGEVVLAYTTGWLGRLRFRRSLLGLLEASRGRVPWDRRRLTRVVAGTTGLVLWVLALDALVDLVQEALPS